MSDSISLDDLRLDDFLGHIQEAVRRIFRYTENVTKEEFLENELIQDAVTRNLEIIGEASGNILKRYSDRIERQEIESLKFARGMRNILAHGYFGVNYTRVWGTIQQDLPVLQKQIEKMIAEHGHAQK